MTKKIAIFVEGLTEQIFAKKLIVEVAGRKKVKIQESKYRARKLLDITLSKTEDESSHTCFVLLVDCGNDEQVKSAILDRRDSLIKSGYELVVGLRDLYPKNKAEYPKLEKGLMTRVPTKDLPITFVIAVMEIEAWFLQEWNHYQNIDPKLTLDRIKNGTNFDPANDKADEIEQPAVLLNQIYQLVGKAYKKDRGRLSRTVNALDYENIYFEIRKLLPQLNQFVDLVDSFV